jgi:hypothetical protein
MSAITFTFEDLCAFFTRKLPRRLMVGLIDNRGSSARVPTEDIHQPFIVIREVGGDIVKQYQGFDQVNGDIFLDLHQGSSPHIISELMKEDGLRRPFSYLVDIENELYPGTSLDVDASGCKARLHFRDGLLYTTGKLFNCSFAPIGDGQGRTGNPTLKMAVSCGLDVTVPEGGSAELFFGNGQDGFRFEAGKDYRVSVTNRAPSHNNNHFQYYYGIVGGKLPFKLVPAKFYETSDEGQGAEVGDPLCSIGGFGGADYQIETPHLDW